MIATAFSVDILATTPITTIYELVVERQATTHHSTFGGTTRHQCMCPSIRGRESLHTNGDSDPSAYLFPDQHRWKCFGCGLGGGKLALIIEGVPVHERLAAFSRESATIAAGREREGKPALPRRINDLERAEAMAWLRERLHLPLERPMRAQPPASAHGSRSSLLNERRTGEWIYENLDRSPRFKVVRYDGDPKPGTSRTKRYEQWECMGPAKSAIRITSWQTIDSNGYRWLRRRSCTPVPYRLPELAQAIAAGDVIWIVEGEKCADAIIAAGGHATTNPGGKGFNYTDEEWLFFFRGGTFLDSPDADFGGRAAGVARARALRQIAQSVAIVDVFPGEMNSQRDMHDYLEKFEPRERFIALRELETLALINL